MKIAIPSDDKVTLSQHFGRTMGFIIFDTDENRITGEEYRINTFTGHATGHLHEHHAGHGDHHHDHQNDHFLHTHGRIIHALHDCDVVIAGGMGPRLFQDLTESGKQIVITRQNEARKAAELFLNKQLQSDKDTCSHH